MHSLAAQDRPNRCVASGCPGQETWTGGIEAEAANPLCREQASEFPCARVEHPSVIATTRCEPATIRTECQRRKPRCVIAQLRERGASACVPHMRHLAHRIDR